MKKVYYLFIAGTLSIMILPTCTSDVYNPDICFQENVLPIFVTNCAQSHCHNSIDHKEGYDLSNYEGIMKGVVPKHPLQSEVYNVIHGSHPSMPPEKKLDQKDISYIQIWIKMGAKNSSNCSPCDTSAYTYSQRIAPLMASWCTGCHMPGNTGGGYDFTTYSGVTAAVTAGRLLGAIRHDPHYIAMPQGTSAKLSDCDISAVEKWVGSGYPNN